MISIILPFFNSERYIKKAIISALEASHYNDEIILINDGSIDKSKEIALSFKDSRISYFEQDNKGVSAARNVGLANMKGEYFCFLDADDIFTTDSLNIRLKKLLDNPNVDFVDGSVLRYNSDLSHQISIWSPSFRGNPFLELVRLNGKPFHSPTWLIRRKSGIEYQFQEGLTHGEDLLFYMEMTRYGGIYDYISEPILKYRENSESAMKNLKGLERGYRHIEQTLKEWEELSFKDIKLYQLRWRKAMFLSYVRSKQFSRAFSALT